MGIYYMEYMCIFRPTKPTRTIHKQRVLEAGHFRRLMSQLVFSRYCNPEEIGSNGNEAIAC